MDINLSRNEREKEKRKEKKKLVIFLHLFFFTSFSQTLRKIHRCLTFSKGFPEPFDEKTFAKFTETCPNLRVRKKEMGLGKV